MSSSESMNPVLSALRSNGTVQSVCRIYFKQGMCRFGSSCKFVRLVQDFKGGYQPLQ